MTPPRLRFIIYPLLAAVMALAGARLYAARRPPPAPPAPPVFDMDILSLGNRAEGMLIHGKFSALEAEAAADRQPIARFKGGYAKLNTFYNALGSFEGSQNACGCTHASLFAFGEKLSAIQAWRTAKPGSAAASVALARLWINMAWMGRGHRFADETPAEAMDLFSRRLALSAAYLKPLDPRDDPAIYEAMLSVIRGTADGRTYMAAIYPRAVQAFPDYFYYYRQMAGLLEPKWFGAPGELASYLKLLAAPEAGDNGAMAYAFVAEGLLADYSAHELFTRMGLDWPIVRRGLQLRADRYGSSTKLLNAELHLAVGAADGAYAAPIARKLGNRWDPTLWEDWSTFAAFSEWAQHAAP